MLMTELRNLKVGDCFMTLLSQIGLPLEHIAWMMIDSRVGMVRGCVNTVGKNTDFNHLMLVWPVQQFDFLEQEQLMEKVLRHEDNQVGDDYGVIHLEKIATSSGAPEGDEDAAFINNMIRPHRIIVASLIRDLPITYKDVSQAVQKGKFADLVMEMLIRQADPQLNPRYKNMIELAKALDLCYSTVKLGVWSGKGR